MSVTVPRQLRTWRDEVKILWQRSWWMLALLGALSWLPQVPVVQAASVIVTVAVVVVLLVWLALTTRRMPRTAGDKWRRGVARHVVESWPALAARLGLVVRNIASRSTVSAGIGTPSWEGWTCVIAVALPQGLGREHLQSQAGLIAQAFGARRATVHGSRIDSLVLRLEFADRLERPVVLDERLPWNGAAVHIGIDSVGAPRVLRLGPHTLVAGCSGSGKASLVWGLLLGLADPIRAGIVEVWGVDLKGGMELALGRPLLTRFADDAAHAVVLLEQAVSEMQTRARALAGKTRQHTPTASSPTVVVLIDELAALTAYETDRDLLRRANAAIAVLASQGRAVGFVVFACLQDPRKETLPTRGLFTQVIGLRLRDRSETAMVLGEGAVAAGALCHETSPTTPGLAYLLAPTSPSVPRPRSTCSSPTDTRAGTMARGGRDSLPRRSCDSLSDSRSISHLS